MKKLTRLVFMALAALSLIRNDRARTVILAAGLDARAAGAIGSLAGRRGEVSRAGPEGETAGARAASRSGRPSETEQVRERPGDDFPDESPARRDFRYSYESQQNPPVPTLGSTTPHPPQELTAKNAPVLTPVPSW